MVEIVSTSHKTEQINISELFALLFSITVSLIVIVEDSDFLR